MNSIWDGYESQSHFDELVSSKGEAREAADKLVRHIADMEQGELDKRRQMAEATIQEMGISFTVYTEEGNIDRAWPFDIIPRAIPSDEWKHAAEGLKQRLYALNMFIDDLYHEQNIIHDGIIPEHVIKESPNFLPECIGVSPAYGVWAHICGTDLVRDGDGKFFVLEDNLRVPSGVSYMLENRAITKRVLPEMFEKENILPLDDYCSQLFDMLASDRKSVV